MRLAYVLLSAIAETARHRPAGYLEELAAVTIRRDESRIWVDKDSDGWKALRDKYAKRREKEPRKPKPPKPTRDERTRALWVELHRYALAYTGDREAAEKWLKTFAARVPCGDCRRHWGDLTTANPPTLANDDAFFQWSVERHNDVNRMLNKPVWTVKQARAEYTTK